MTRKPEYTSRQHIGLGRVSATALSPDGQWMAVEVSRLDQAGADYVGDLWKVPLDGGEPVQLTRGDSRDGSPCFRHDGALGFLSNRKPAELKADEGAQKRSQVWLLPADGGEPCQVTDEPLGVQGFQFARRGDRLAYTAPVLPGVEHDKQRDLQALPRRFRLLEALAGGFGLLLVVTDQEPHNDIRVDRDHCFRALIRSVTAAFICFTLLDGCPTH